MAIIGSAFSAIGTIVAGHEAAGATADASKRAANVTREGMQQQAQLAAPYTNMGQGAIPMLESLLGIPTTSMSPQAGQPGYTGGGQPGAAPSGSQGSPQQTLESLPGYQFTKQQGQQAVTAQANAMGLGGSGNILAAFDKYTTGLADQTYQQQVQNMLNVIGYGQGAAAGQAANIGQGSANLANIATNQGNNIANIDMATMRGVAGAVGQGINNYTTLKGLSGDPSTAGDPAIASQIASQGAQISNPNLYSLSPGTP
jgi:hypothetical protein